MPEVKVGQHRLTRHNQVPIDPCTLLAGGRPDQVLNFFQGLKALIINNRGDINENKIREHIRLAQEQVHESTLKELTKNEERIASLVRHAKDYAIEAPVKNQIEVILSGSSPHLREPLENGIHFALGAHYPNSLYIEQQIEYAAASSYGIETLYKELEAKIISLRNAVCQVSKSFGHTLENFCLEYIREQHQRVLHDKPMPKEDKVLQRFFAIYTKEMLANEKISLDDQRKLALALVLIAWEIDKLLTKYETALTQAKAQLIIAERLIVENDVYFILYLAKQNRIIREFLQHPYWQPWLRNVMLTIFSPPYGQPPDRMEQEGVSELELVIAACSSKTGGLLKLSVRQQEAFADEMWDPQAYTELDDMAEHLLDEGVTPLDLAYMIELHSGKRQFIMDRTQSLPREDGQRLTRRVLDTTLAERTINIDAFFPFTQQTISIHGTPALVNSALNKLVLAQFALSLIPKSNNLFEKALLSPCAFLLLVDALKDVTSAKENEAASSAASYNLTQGIGTLPTFFKRNINDSIRADKKPIIDTWEQAKAYLKEEIRSQFPTYVSSSMDDNTLFEKAKQVRFESQFSFRH